MPLPRPIRQAILVCNLAVRQKRGMDMALREAIRRAGGQKALARELGVAKQAIQQWKRCPPVRVLEVERITGVFRHDLRSDIYPIEPIGFAGPPLLDCDGSG